MNYLKSNASPAEYRKRFRRNATRESREIQAFAIKQAVMAGMAIDLRHAIVRGALEMENIIVEEEMRFLQCEFEAPVRLSHSVVRKNLIFSGSTFLGGCELRRTTVTGDCRLSRCRFLKHSTHFDGMQALSAFLAKGVLFSGGSVTFSSASFGQNVSFRGARFDAGATFDDARFLSNADFRGAVFAQKASFVAAAISGQAIFIGATFKADATFNGLKSTGRAFFCGPPGRAAATTFEGDVDFIGAKFASGAEFQGALFCKKAQFGDCRFGGGAVFYAVDDPRTPGSRIVTTFRGSADFANVHIEGSANFSESVFEQTVNFRGAYIGGDACFNQMTARGEATFNPVTVKGNSQFIGADFNDKVSFNAAHFLGHALFGSEPRPAVFQGDADFSLAIFDASAGFAGCAFSKKANFSNCRFGGDAMFFAWEVPPTPGTVGVEHRFASFRGEADFSLTTFSGSAGFVGCVFNDNVLFSFAHIDGLALFQSSTGAGPKVTLFGKNADFSDVRVLQIAAFKSAQFKGEARFDRSDFRADLVLESSQFSGPTASFDSVNVGGKANFQHVSFGGAAVFTGAHIAGQAQFVAARFESTGATAVNFYAASIDNTLFFSDGGQDGATFAGGASFIRLQVKGDSYFHGVRFNHPSEAVSFDSAQFGGKVEFSYGNVAMARFAGPVTFVNTRFSGAASFSAVEFCCGANFSGATMEDTAEFLRSSFRPGVQAQFVGSSFRKRIDFHDSTFEAPADFSRAQFEATADFTGCRWLDTVKFQACRFRGQALFNEQPPADGQTREGGGATFADVYFDHAQFEQDAHFEERIFRGHASFRDATFRALNFSENGKIRDQDQFQSGVDLRGCTYNTVKVSWKPLFRLPDGRPRLQDDSGLPEKVESALQGTSQDNRQDQAPDLITALRASVRQYDRQPYDQLESVFRKAGQNELAGEVYLERRRIERKEKWQHNKIRWLGDWLYGFVARYGQQPLRLLVASVVLLVFGAAVLSRTGALEAVKGASTCSKAGLSVDSVGVTLREFFPGVDIPMGASCQPSSEYVVFKIPASVFATFFLRVPGWVLVPIGLLALSGVLRRASS